jgi:ESS family glutamate:Na+ symporter
MQPAETSVLVVRLDLIQTLAVGSGLFFLGIFAKRRLPILERLNIPSAVIGGLFFAALMLMARDRFLNVQIDTTGQPLFMVAFFTTIGMQASLPLLRTGGKDVLKFLAMASLFCVIQNFIGMGVASLFGKNPLVGVIAGSVTLVGGPATGMAFAPLFEQAGVQGAAPLAITAATFGIICGAVLGGPAGSWLIKKHRLKSTGAVAEGELEKELHETQGVLTLEMEREDSTLAVNLIVIGIAMGLGSIVSGSFQSLGWHRFSGTSTTPADG